MEMAANEVIGDVAELFSQQMNVRSLKVSQLKVSKQNVRNDVEEVNGNDESTVVDLANSIKVNGLLNPISVRPTSDGYYEVFAGQRRLKAVQHLNWENVTCNVFPAEMTDNDAKVKSLVENFQRQDNSYKDKVEAFSTLLDGYCKGSIAELCRIVGTTAETAKKYVKLKALPPEVLGLLDKNEEGSRLFVQTATKLVALPPAQQVSVARMLVGKSISEVKAVMQHVTQNPHILEPARIETMVQKAMDNHSLNVAVQAQLIAKTSWREHEPWIHDPHDPDAVFRIKRIDDEVFQALEALNAIEFVQFGYAPEILTKKRKLPPEQLPVDDDEADFDGPSTPARTPNRTPVKFAEAVSAGKDRLFKNEKKVKEEDIIVIDC